ncbi:Superoxide dismutase [Cu-Zn] 3 [Labeo rohita]|uniref:Superoxide dismutase [Cu-Zn] 3 n=1 Tax=Labeo rohita TaxID=84645 RepID=A0ABQ8MHK8_LABRO|nr:Superoxide dismutase [Cu-Zn] 3 [Labeo rohita]
MKTSNRFSPLSDAPTEKPDQSALVIGDSIVRNVKIETPATIVQCLPGARAPEILANLKVLANAKRKLRKIAIHIGSNDVRLCQSEITKNNIKEVCEVASTMSVTVICSGPLPAYHGDEIHSRLLSLNGWMSKWCLQNNRVGAVPLYLNMAHSLRVCTGLKEAQVTVATRSRLYPDQMVTAATQIQSVSRPDGESAPRDNLYSLECQRSPCQLDEPQRQIPFKDLVT